MKQLFTSVAYLQSNRQVKVINRSIVQTLKVWLMSAKRRWVDDLPSALWSYRTTERIGIWENPYSMVYGTTAVFSKEIAQDRIQIINYILDNDALRDMDLGLLDKRRSRVAMWLATYKKKMDRAYNKKVWPWSLDLGNMVMKKIQRLGEKGKLDPKYKGPFKVVEKSWHRNMLFGRCWREED